MENKEQALEEAAKSKYGIGYGAVDSINAFIEGAKWQQKKMYSEEEVLKLLNNREDYINSVDNIFEYQSNEEWFEQFKKK